MYDHNRHLMSIIKMIGEGEMDDDLIHSLSIELKFATVNSVNYRGAPVHIKRNGRYYLMLYVTHDDLMDHFPDWPHSHLDFEWFLEYTHCPAYYFIEDESIRIRPCSRFQTCGGIIFLMDDEEYIIEGELLDYLNEFFKIDLYSVQQLKEKFDSMDYERLEELLCNFPRDWDEIIRQMGKSTLLFTTEIPDGRKHEEFDMIFDFFRFGPFGFNTDIAVSTTADIPGHEYAVIVNFKDMVDHALNFGLSEITVSTPKGEVRMSRQLLIEKYEMIEKYCDDSKIKQSHECIFRI